VVDGLRGLERGAWLVRKLLISGGLEPLATVGSGLLEKLVEVDRHGRAVRLLGLDGDGWPGGDANAEAHHDLVDRTDLLDIERSVGETLALEDEEAAENAEDGAVGNERQPRRRGGG